MRCIDCYNAIQQDSGIKFISSVTVRTSHVKLDKASVSEWSSIHFHPCAHLKGLVHGYDSSSHLSGFHMQRIFAPHTPVTQGLTIILGLWVKACRRRPASSARSRMARHWRSLIQHGISR